MELGEYITRNWNKKVDVEKLDKFIIEDKVWIPEKGDLMYYLDIFGDVGCHHYGSDNTLNIKILEFQKVFKTKEEAEFEIEKRKFLLFMEREFIRNSDEIDWEGYDQEKYFIYFDYNNSLIGITENYTWRQTTLYTTNKKWLEGFIEDNEEDIKKYYFEI